MKRTIVAVGAVLVVARAVWGLDVTACNTIMPAGAVGVLQNDLHCAGSPGGVFLDEGATLELNGHAISGAPVSGSLIGCRGRRCTVAGPGALSGPTVAIALLRGRQKLTVSDLSIHDCTTGVLDVVSGKPSLVQASNVSVSSCGVGYQVGKLRGSDVAAVGNGGPGFSVDRVIATNVIANGNGAAGIFGIALKVTGLVANGNGDAGVRVTRARLRDATLTGNDGYGLGFDLLVRRRPNLVNVTCGKSGIPGELATANWGVCAGD